MLRLIAPTNVYHEATFHALIAHHPAQLRNYIFTPFLVPQAYCEWAKRLRRNHVYIEARIKGTELPNQLGLWIL